MLFVADDLPTFPCLERINAATIVEREQSIFLGWYHVDEWMMLRRAYENIFYSKGH